MSSFENAHGMAVHCMLESMGIARTEVEMWRNWLSNKGLKDQLIHIIELLDEFVHEVNSLDNDVPLGAVIRDVKPEKVNDEERIIC